VRHQFSRPVNVTVSKLSISVLEVEPS
jgi:hypothetical protein